MNNIWKLVVSILVPILASVIGGIFTASSVSKWYAKLKKPSFNPPNWIFGPVWTILYLMMGVSLYLVWITKFDQLAFVIFGIQLFLNVLWSIIFFGIKNPFYAFIEIVLLWIAILLTIVYFYNISPISAYLLIPYILWVSFASILNYAIYKLN